MKHNKTLSKILASSMILSTIATPVSASSWWDKLGDTVGSVEDIVDAAVDTVVGAVGEVDTGDLENFLDDAKDVIVEEIAPTVSEEFSDWYENESGKEVLEEAFDSLVEDLKTELEDVKEQLEDSDFEYAEELGGLLEFLTDDDNQEKIESAVEDVVGAVVGAVENLDLEDVQNVVDVLEELVNGEGALSDDVLDKLGLNEDELSDLKDFYEENKEDLDALRDYVSETYKDVADEIDQLTNESGDIAWKQLEDSLTKLAGAGTTENLSDTLVALTALIEKSVEIGSDQNLFGEDDQEKIAIALNQISKALYSQSVEGELSEINGVLSDILKVWAVNLGADPSVGFNSGDLNSSLEDILDFLIAFVDAVESEASEEIDALNTSGGALVDEFNEEVKTNNGLFGSIAGFFQGIFDDINEYIENKNSTPPIQPAPPAPPAGEEETPTSSSKETVESKTERTIIYHENGCVTIVLTNDTTGSLRKITRMPDGVVLLQTYKEGVVYVSVTGVKGDVELYLPYDVRPLSSTKVLQSDVEGKYNQLHTNLVEILEDALVISVNKNFSLQIHDSYEV